MGSRNKDGDDFLFVSNTINEDAVVDMWFALLLLAPSSVATVDALLRFLDIVTRLYLLLIEIEMMPLMGK